MQRERDAESSEDHRADIRDASLDRGDGRVVLDGVDEHVLGIPGHDRSGDGQDGQRQHRAAQPPESPVRQARFAVG